VFKSTSPFTGNSLDSMKRAYKAELEKEFAAHICAKFPKGTDGKQG
jgi:hypothetical protein